MKRNNLMIIFYKYVLNYLCRIEFFFNFIKIIIFKMIDDYNICVYVLW